MCERVGSGMHDKWQGGWSTYYDVKTRKQGGYEN